MKVDDFVEKPMLVFMNNCVNTIAQIPAIPDKKNPEDVDTKAEDHLYDALRYGIMTRPRSSIWDYNLQNNDQAFKQVTQHSDIKDIVTVLSVQFITQTSLIVVQMPRNLRF